LIWERRLLHCWLPWFALYRFEAFLFCFACLLSVEDPCINFTWFSSNVSFVDLDLKYLSLIFGLVLIVIPLLLLRCWFCMLYVELLYFRVRSLALVVSNQNFTRSESSLSPKSESDFSRVQMLQSPESFPFIYLSHNQLSLIIFCTLNKLLVHKIVLYYSFVIIKTLEVESCWTNLVPTEPPSKNQTQPQIPISRWTGVPQSVVTREEPRQNQYNSTRLQINELLLDIVSLLHQQGTRLANMGRNQEIIPIQIASQIQQNQQTAILGDTLSQSWQEEHNRPPQQRNNNNESNKERGARNGGNGVGEGPPPHDSSNNNNSMTTSSWRKGNRESIHHKRRRTTIIPLDALFP
jgi:hypothetical protein